MYLKFSNYLEVDNLVQWLSEYVAPGRLYKTWKTEINGQDVYLSDDNVSWELTYYYMSDGKVELKGLDLESETMLKFSLEFIKGTL